DDAVRGRLVGRIAKGHGPQRQRRNLECRTPEITIINRHYDGLLMELYLLILHRRLPAIGSSAGSFAQQESRWARPGRLLFGSQPRSPGDHPSTLKGSPSSCCETKPSGPLGNSPAT